MNERTGVLIVIDDDLAAQKGVAALASSMGITCVTFGSAEEFLDTCQCPEIGCLLVDFRLGGMNGLELLEQLTAAKFPLPVILISAYADVATAVRAMQQGALTLIEKPYRADDLAQAIRAAIEQSRERFATMQRETDVKNRLASLTHRERIVMQQIIEGRPNKAVARDLDISLRTVDRIRASIFEKMGANSAIEVARIVTEAGLFPTSNPANTSITVEVNDDCPMSEDVS